MYDFSSFNAYGSPAISMPSWMQDASSIPPGAPMELGFLDRLKANLLPQYNDKGQMTGQGLGSLALGTAQGLFNGYLGLKQYGLAKDQFAEAKRQFGLNYDAQRQTTNASLEDRQRARVASNPGAYQSVADYMSKYGIPGG